MASYGIVVAFAFLLALGMLVFAASSARRRKNGNLAAVFTAAVVAAALFLIMNIYIGSYSYYQLFVAVAFAAIGSMIIMLYNDRPLLFIAITALLVLAIIINYQYVRLGIGMFGVGSIIGLVYREALMPGRREDKNMRRSSVEVRRDFFQMLLGIILLAVIFLARSYYIFIIFGLIILGYLLSNIIAFFGGSQFRYFEGLERKGVEFGKGALHLAAGVALLVGFGSVEIAIFGIAALLIADAMATIVGMSLYKSPRIPHNKRKSYAGALAFFVVALVFGVATLGIVYGVLMAAALTIIESLELPVDDNIALPIATLLLGLLIV